jgi:hypothetical protein
MNAPEVLYGVGTFALLVVLAWGVWQYNHRNRANDRVTERATRDLYEHPRSYKKREFEKDLKKP